ncbi:MAG: hypothetical protein RMK20_08190, partial [Verrucomicrobiales bacterium]|nr:hypothetical protein [Verrucomicrobiales bacterium]
VVAVKPIPRWKIWLGKWLGIVSLDAALLALSGAAVFALLQWRATKLPEAERRILRQEVLVARGSVKPPTYERELEEETARQLRAVLERSPEARANIEELRKQVRESLKSEMQIVPPGHVRIWEIDLGAARHRARGKPMHLRVKFNTAQYTARGTFTALWQVGQPESPRFWRSEPMSLAPDTFHEFEIPPDLFDDNGVLTVVFLNFNDTTLLFPLEEGIEVLYAEGGFALNYARGLGIIFCWMAALAALGLATASFLSFPVAAFTSLALLTMALSTGTLSTVVSEGTIMGYDAEKGGPGRSPVDVVVVPVFRALLTVINLAKGFAPIDALSMGRSVSWAQLGRAFGQIVLVLGGGLALIGIAGFYRRELAAAQTQ